MKRGLVLLLIVIMLCSAVACGQRSEPLDMEPKISQVKSICELAVMECYYHNVAKFNQENVEGLLWWQKDKHFWIEYSGIVKLGIDVSLVDMEVVENQITITLPEAKVLGCKVDSASLNKESYIVDIDSAAISAEDEIEAFKEAQRQLEENASNDHALLAGAQQRAQALLEDYITNIGNAVGKEYAIQWIYLDADGNRLNDVVTADPPDSQDNSVNTADTSS